MNGMIKCAAPHCGRLFEPDPRAKNQEFCGLEDCQRARKRKWQKKKLAADPDYRANQRRCQKEWHERHPGYYSKYRRDHPRYRKRNSFLQRCRNARGRMIAKMDAIKPAPIKDPALFFILPAFAKMDASPQKVLIIPVSYMPSNVIAKEDSIDSAHSHPIS